MITANDIAQASSMVFELISGDSEVHEVLEALGLDPNAHQEFGAWIVVQIAGLRRAHAESGGSPHPERGYWLDGFLVGLAAAKLAAEEDASRQEG